MGRPSKPTSVLKDEKKSHRTKEEIKERAAFEKELLTGIKLKEDDRVKKNNVAHSEYKRVKKLFETIGKNDNIYGAVINRYCLIYSECTELEERRDKVNEMVESVKKSFVEFLGTSGMNPTDKAEMLLDLTDRLAKLSSLYLAYDKQVMTKRKMLFDIEKENIMTVAGALRSVPKAPKKKISALADALSDDD